MYVVYVFEVFNRLFRKRKAYTDYAKATAMERRTSMVGSALARRLRGESLPRRLAFVTLQAAPGCQPHGW